MRVLFNKFEDPKWPLLGPNIWALQTFGLWQPKGHAANLKFNIFHSIFAFYIATEFVELWLIRSDFYLALRNLSYSLLSLVCLMKVGTFIIWQDDWSNIINYITVLENRQRSTKDKKTNIIIDEYTQYSRAVTFFYWFLVICTVLAVVIFPLVEFYTVPAIPNSTLNGTVVFPEIMSSWFPFDKSRGYGYVISLLIQISVFTWGGWAVGSYDSTAVTIMAFIAGQLKLLKINCERLFGDKTENVTEEESIKRIKQFHNEYVSLVK